MLRGSFTLRVAGEEVTINEGDTLIIAPDTVHTPVAAGPKGCELIGMSVADIRSSSPTEPRSASGSIPQQGSDLIATARHE